MIKSLQTKKKVVLSFNEPGLVFLWHSFLGPLFLSVLKRLNSLKLDVVLVLLFFQKKVTWFV